MFGAIKGATDTLLRTYEKDPETHFIFAGVLSVIAVIAFLICGGLYYHHVSSQHDQQRQQQCITEAMTQGADPATVVACTDIKRAEVMRCIDAGVQSGQAFVVGTQTDHADPLTLPTLCRDAVYGEARDYKSD